MIARDDVPAGPIWHKKTIVLPDAPNEPQTLYYRDVQECAKFLFEHPSFVGDVDYAPAEVYEDGGPNGRTRVFHEMYTGDDWINAQVSKLE